MTESYHKSSHDTSATQPMGETGHAHLGGSDIVHTGRVRNFAAEAARAPAQADQVECSSLSDLTELAKGLRPDVPFHACPQATDRSAWESLPKELKNSLVEEGEKYLGVRPPAILMTDFMEFSRTGNRTHYEDMLFERMTTLDALVLAECVEYRGRFLDDIVNLIFLLCEETAWQLPAHNSHPHGISNTILPDVTHPVLDLFAAEAGAILGVVEYLLRDAFREVSPAVSLAVNSNLESRVFTPYLEEHYWWMGDGKSTMCNWTSWCTQNVLLAAFTRPESYWRNETGKTRKDEIFQKACQSLDYFLNDYGEDGCCDEGPQYFRHAGLTLFNALEILNDATDGGFLPVYGETKIRNIAAYIRNVHVDGPYYVNFADCSPAAGRCDAREYLFGKRTRQSGLSAWAAADYREGGDFLTRKEHNLFYRIQTAFHYEEMMTSPPPTDLPQNIYYESAGIFLARDTRYFLAVKAGDNGDSHNHNDVGSVTVYKDGSPFLIDIGVESYTAKTFSSSRYEIWTMQSAYHNLPTFGSGENGKGGVMQADGEQYRASDVCVSFEEEKAEISMDIAGAYPDDRIRSYRRTASLKKGEGIEITDICCELPLELKPVVLSLMTYEKPRVTGAKSEKAPESSEPGQGVPEVHLQIGSLGECILSGASEIACDEIPITDPRLGQAWKHSIYRTRITMDGSRLSVRIF